MDSAERLKGTKPRVEHQVFNLCLLLWPYKSHPEFSGVFLSLIIYYLPEGELC